MCSRWKLPPVGWVKVNVHGVYYDNRLPNGNRSGVGAVLRDDDGEILLMVSGCIENVNPRANELLSMTLGLRLAYAKGKHRVILETEHAEAHREWENSQWWMDDRHRSVVDQLNHRKEDRRLKLEVSIVGKADNMLARFLAEDGAANRTKPVMFRRHFGRVRELWHLDLGLGYVGEGYDIVEEEEYLEQERLAIEAERMGEQMMENAEDLVSGAVIRGG